MVTEIDQDLSPLLAEIFHIIGFRSDPDETRTKTEYIKEPVWIRIFFFAPEWFIFLT